MILVLFTIAALATTITACRFLVWRRALERTLDSNAALVTTPAGIVEYTEVGFGRPVLMLHGTPGGYDQVLGHLRAAGVAGGAARYIVPSRPGYLRTPLDAGRSPEQQAQLFSALLTQLGVDRAVVIGISGGGPSALAFATHYSERCSGLILLAAATKSIGIDGSGLPATLADFLIYLFRKLEIARMQAKSPGDPVISRFAAGVIDSLVPTGRRAVGHANDREQFAHIQELAFGAIGCPTLILHGTNDTDVPIAHAEYAHSRIAGSEFVKFEGADHSMITTEYKELYRMMQKFIDMQPAIATAEVSHPA